MLLATRDRAPHYGCFGMHEWAMVYRQPAEQVRHRAWPLRLGATGTDEVVEGHRIVCSHFDAFRFFTDAARPLNALQPGSRDRARFEWAIIDPSGRPTFGGVAYVKFAADNRMRSVIGFFGPIPDEVR